MKYLLTTISVLIILVPAGTREASTVPVSWILPAMEMNREVFTAGWEKEAFSVIHGDSVVNAILDGTEPGIRIDSLCSEESINRLHSVRHLLVSVIESGKSTSALKHSAIEALLLVSRIDFHELNSGELRAIETSDLGIITNLFSISDKTITFPPPVGNIRAEMVMPGITASGNDKKNGRVINHAAFRSRLMIKVSVNSREYEINHADYYRLFLYIMDYTGGTGSFIINGPLFPAFSHTSLRSRTHNQPKITTANHKKYQHLHHLHMEVQVENK